jgi:hypothetical protein
MNIQHSSRFDDWLTPVDILNKVRMVLGSIDVDPASSEYANKRVGASRYITETADGLEANWCNWPSRIFINPPGGKIKNRSKTIKFWEHLMHYRSQGLVSQAIFLCFSVEALQSSQGKGVPAIGEFPFCVPAKRIHFDREGVAIAKAPSHSNAIVYVPGKENNSKLFANVFRDVGTIINEKVFNEQTTARPTESSQATVAGVRGSVARIREPY